MQGKGQCVQHSLRTDAVLLSCSDCYTSHWLTLGFHSYITRPPSDKPPSPCRLQSLIVSTTRSYRWVANIYLLKRIKLYQIYGKSQLHYFDRCGMQFIVSCFARRCNYIACKQLVETSYTVVLSGITLLSKTSLSTAPQDVSYACTWHLASWRFLLFISSCQNPSDNGSNPLDGLRKLNVTYARVFN